MCRVISLSALDPRAKAFVESFGGDGIVADPTKEEDDAEQEQEAYNYFAALQARVIKPVKKGQLW